MVGFLALLSLVALFSLLSPVFSSELPGDERYQDRSDVQMDESVTKLYEAYLKHTNLELSDAICIEFIKLSVRLFMILRVGTRRPCRTDLDQLEKCFLDLFKEHQKELQCRATVGLNSSSRNFLHALKIISWALKELGLHLDSTHADLLEISISCLDDAIYFSPIKFVSGPCELSGSKDGECSSTKLELASGQPSEPLTLLPKDLLLRILIYPVFGYTCPDCRLILKFRLVCRYAAFIFPLFDLFKVHTDLLVSHLRHDMWPYDKIARRLANLGIEHSKILSLLDGQLCVAHIGESESGSYVYVHPNPLFALGPDAVRRLLLKHYQQKPSPTDEDIETLLLLCHHYLLIYMNSETHVDHITNEDCIFLDGIVKFAADTPGALELPDVYRTLESVLSRLSGVIHQDLDAHILEKDKDAIIDWVRTKSIWKDREGHQPDSQVEV